MKTRTAVPSVVIIALALVANAVQPSDVWTTEAAFADGYAAVSRDVREALEMMPDARLSYRPVPEVRTFAAVVAHISAHSISTCADVRGEKPPAGVNQWNVAISRAELREQIAQADAMCESAYRVPDLAALNQVVVLADGRFKAERGNLLVNNLTHMTQYYGTLATYLRMNGLVPPTTARLRKAKP